MYTALIKVINETGEKVVGHTTVPNKPRPVKLERRLGQKITKRNKAVQNWKRACSATSQNCNSQWVKAKRLIKKARRAIKKDKKKKGMKWLKKNIGQSKQLWDKLNKRRNDKNIEVVQKDNTESTNISDIKEYIVDYWTEMGKKGETTMEDSCNGSPNEDLDNILRKRITVVEITKAKMTFKNGKSTGWDDIPNEFLKYGGDHLDTAIATVFTNMIEDEWTPAEWNDEKLTMIHKKRGQKQVRKLQGNHVLQQPIQTIHQDFGCQGNPIHRR
jgi:hypothetical protein